MSNLKITRRGQRVLACCLTTAIMILLYLTSIKIMEMIHFDRVKILLLHQSRQDSPNKAIAEYYGEAVISSNAHNINESKQRDAEWQQRETLLRSTKLGPTKNVTPVFLTFTYPTSPPPKKYRVEKSIPYTEDRANFPLLALEGTWKATFDRLNSYDTGRAIQIPVEEFSLTQPVSSDVLRSGFQERLLPGVSESNLKYFHECGIDKKRDVRFATDCPSVDTSLLSNYRAMPRQGIALHLRHSKRLVPIHNTGMALQALSEMLKAWTEFAESNEIIYWMAHGALLGWFWNGRLLPWDVDLDVQMSTHQLLELVRYNQTLISGRFLVDVNPNFLCRTVQRDNVIDARIVDKMTGYMIDITSVSMVLEAKGSRRLYDKTPHPYQYDDIMPLQETILEGIRVWRPRAILKILKEEYKENAMVETRHRPYTSNKLYRFNKKLKIWQDSEKPHEKT
ncbi:hypothetical protein BCR33DRAFT_852934 [Rhizoclosmatium globosum]|uniref:LicD/FKTN/FKRP nucleotidyltransferase domain-containing protein n=1 Tax=Rhizoclosmatium globosum TaxID=329046 RepID=A0A1Y2BZL2_9FUNG|nr:hypothetical protein BCR33DRAFT_852934 [Rhizoclosmatium globosum]|eukprot:ORY40222.1 hypothetical protein BCR33DRAFT_852934 [Rhizoclosmatium globosum]